MKHGMEPFLVLNRTISSKSVSSKFSQDLFHITFCFNHKLKEKKNILNSGGKKLAGSTGDLVFPAAGQSNYANILFNV